MDNKEYLGKMLDGIINDNDDQAREEFSNYLKSKTKDIIDREDHYSHRDDSNLYDE